MAVIKKYTLQNGWTEAIRNERICLERDMLFKNVGGKFGSDLEKSN
jgi:hypothetical protein